MKELSQYIFEKLHPSKFNKEVNINNQEQLMNLINEYINQLHSKKEFFICNELQPSEHKGKRFLIMFDDNSKCDFYFNHFIKDLDLPENFKDYKIDKVINKEGKRFYNWYFDILLKNSSLTEVYKDIIKIINKSIVLIKKYNFTYK